MTPLLIYFQEKKELHLLYLTFSVINMTEKYLNRINSMCDLKFTPR